MGRQIVRAVQCVEGKGYQKKRRLLCNAEDRGSRFAPSERKQTSDAYQLHEGIGSCECIRFNYTKVRTMQTMKLQWNQIDWKKAEEQVNRIQIRIVKATLEQKWRLVKRLQYLITNSFYAKVLAVRRVVTNKGKNTPGIDGVLWKTDRDKIHAVQNHWNFRKFKGKLIIQPSRKSLSKITAKVSELIKNSRTSKQDILILKLNEITRGWANYHHSACAKRAFSTIDHRIWEMLWKWAKRRHPNKSKHWIVDRYWKTHKGRKWSFMTDKQILFLLMDMPIVRKGQMALNKNPFLDREYFENRAKKHRLNRKKAICSNRAAQIGYYAL